MYYDNDWALVIPMANEEPEYEEFVVALTKVLDRLKSGRVYMVVDHASVDKTLELCKSLSSRDSRFTLVWSPNNRNVVDAYMAGYREAFKHHHQFIIEMDAGLSHDPAALPMFLRVLNEGNECAFGSRFINGGSMSDSPFSRWLLSKIGTILSNLLLGTSLCDMTSGYQGFQAHIVEKLIQYPLQSKAHFYQTEVRYLLRQYRYSEVPIHYKAPSPRVSQKALLNSLSVLWSYTLKRLMLKPISL